MMEIVNNFGKDLDIIFELGFKRFYIFKNELFYSRCPKILQINNKNKSKELKPFAFIIKTNKLHFDSVCVYENGKIKPLNDNWTYIPLIDLDSIKRMEKLEWIKKNEKQIIPIANKMQGKIFYNYTHDLYKITNGSLKIFFSYLPKIELYEFVKFIQ